ncbi:MAG TPA: Gfo/Idh/MocA family oxidoreductase [Candidatus Eisenbacteria bacterium]|nr:Gfo/Idh/MocA family oxidoreductase [Candidatus Eisenbacteria bacterium]
MPSTDPIRVLIAGSGFGAKVHAPGFAQNPEFRIVGIASGHLETARAAAEAHGVPYATDDWKKMLDEVEAELVSIVTPVDLHYPIARAALERKRHVLCEKPFAMNTAQAKELASLAKAQGVVNVVNHEFRYMPARALMSRMIQEGKLGRLEHIAIQDRIPGWARDPARRITWLADRQRGGGFLGALGSHHVDAITHWAGPVRRVFCRLRTLAATAPGLPPGHQAITADDCFTLMLEMESGATAVVDLFAGSRARRESIEAFGSDDALVIEEARRIGRRTPQGTLEELPIPADLDVPATPEMPLLAPFRVMVAKLRDAIRGGAPLGPTFAEAVEIQKVLDTARLSDQKGGWLSTRSATAARASAG